MTNTKFTFLPAVLALSLCPCNQTEAAALGFGFNVNTDDFGMHFGFNEPIYPVRHVVYERPMCPPFCNSYIGYRPVCHRPMMVVEEVIERPVYRPVTRVIERPVKIIRTPTTYTNINRLVDSIERKLDMLHEHLTNASDSPRLRALRINIGKISQRWMSFMCDYQDEYAVETADLVPLQDALDDVLSAVRKLDRRGADIKSVDVEAIENALIAAVTTMQRSASYPATCLSEITAHIKIMAGRVV